MVKATLLNNPIEWAQKRLDSALQRLPPEDAVIMTAGFIAGTQGYTPITALLRTFGVTSEITATVTTDISQPFETDEGIPVGWFYALFGFPAGAVLVAHNRNVVKRKKLQTDATTLTGDPLLKVQKEVAQLVTQERIATIAMGSVGLIEAYAITRPGAFRAITTFITESLKGIGEIVPG